jgi:hypothetical protein
MPRIRLSEEEYEVIREQRDARILSIRREGGRASGATIANAMAMASKDSVKKAKRIAKKPRTTVPPQDRDVKVAGGKAAAEKRSKILAEYNAAISPDVPRGYVFGMDEEQQPVMGDLRSEQLCIIEPGKVGIISDAHWPFHDMYKGDNGEIRGAYYTAIEHLRAWGVNTLVLNGDMMDVYHLSRHEKLEAKRNWSWELDVARAMLKHLRQFFGDGVRIIYREGNHEERFAAYLARKAQELQGTIHLNEMLGLHALNIEWYDQRAKMKAGNMYIDHGHEYFGSGGIVNPARSYMLKAFDNLIVGHVHKTSGVPVRKPLDGSYLQVFTTGCLCDLSPMYASRNNWNHGYGELTVHDDGSFTFHNRFIMDGRVV